MKHKRKQAVIDGSKRQLPEGTINKRPIDPNVEIEVTLIIRPIERLPRECEGLTEHMTLEDYARSYGMSQQDASKVIKFFKYKGVACGKPDYCGRSIIVKGEAKKIMALFGVRLHAYTDSDGNEFRGRTGPVKIDTKLEHIVTSVFGLDTRRQASTNFRRHRTDENVPSSDLAYKAGELRKMYSFPNAKGAGQCIGILAFGDKYQDSDLRNFFRMNGNDMPSITPIYLNRSRNHPGSQFGNDEVTLDIEVAGSLAPDAKIVCYFSSSTEKGWVDAFCASVFDRLNAPSVISVSWGFPEGHKAWTKSAVRYITETLKAAALLGITVCAASGDDGTGANLQMSVGFPAASPYVLAIGGTSVHRSNGGAFDETAWNDSHGAGGGGVSVTQVRPSWQPRVNCGLSFDGRAIPDVSANANYEPGYHMFMSGDQTPGGGTSAAAPLWAALIACLNQELSWRIGYLTPLLYTGPKLGATCRDITVGSISRPPLESDPFAAGVGWDYSTGFGSPVGTMLLSALTHFPSERDEIYELPQSMKK